MNPNVDQYLSNVKKWNAELEILRTILLDCSLTEDFKWRVPCYTFQGNNIVILGNFKDFCSLSFFKGVLLQDTEQLLVAPGENSQSVRMLKFTDDQEILDKESIIRKYIYEAIDVERAGIKIPLIKSDEIEFAPELLQKIEMDEIFKTAWDALTPGRKRAYNLHFTSSKQSKTRESRIESYTPRILSGKGINDCICGRSKRMPNCDGSHKFID